MRARPFVEKCFKAQYFIGPFGRSRPALSFGEFRKEGRQAEHGVKLTMESRNDRSFRMEEDALDKAST